MQKIELLDQLREKSAGYDELVKNGINYTFARAYFLSVERDLELLDFNDCIFDQEVEQITENLRRFHVDRFTISSSFSGMPEMIAQFNKYRVFIEGGAVKMINAPYKSIISGDPEQIPALVFVVD